MVGDGGGNKKYDDCNGDGDDALYDDGDGDDA